MAEMIKISDDMVTNSTGLAMLSGYSIRRIQQLTQDGILPTVSRGKYCVVDCVNRLIDYVENKNKNSFSEDEAELDRAKKVAETQLKTAKAKIAKFEAEELEGKLHRSEDVESMMVDFASYIRNALIALPGRLAVDVSGATPAVASDIIRKEVYSMLNDFSNYEYDPSKFEDKVRERLNWEAKQQEENSDE